MAVYLTDISYLYPFLPQADLDELVDDDGDGSADTTKFDAMADYVESIFHNYVCGRYQVPLDVTDSTILSSARMFCTRLFEYHLYARRRAVDDEIGSRYQQTIKELEGIRDGKIRFNDPPTDEASVVEGHYNATTLDRNMTSSGMADYGGGDSRES